MPGRGLRLAVVHQRVTTAPRDSIEPPQWVSRGLPPATAPFCPSGQARLVRCSSSPWGQDVGLRCAIWNLSLHQNPGEDILARGVGPTPLVWAGDLGSGPRSCISNEPLARELQALSPTDLSGSSTFTTTTHKRLPPPSRLVMSGLGQCQLEALWHPNSPRRAFLPLPTSPQHTWLVSKTSTTGRGLCQAQIMFLKAVPPNQNGLCPQVAIWGLLASRAHFDWVIFRFPLGTKPLQPSRDALPLRAATGEGKGGQKQEEGATGILSTSVWCRDGCPPTTPRLMEAGQSRSHPAPPPSQPPSEDKVQPYKGRKRDK